MANLLMESFIWTTLTVFLHHYAQANCDINAWNKTDYRLASNIATTDLAPALNATLAHCAFGIRHGFESNKLRISCLKHCSLRHDCVAVYITDEAGCRFCLANADGNQHLNHLDYGDLLVNITKVIGK